MWKPKSVKGNDKDFLQPRRSITLTEFLPRNFLNDHQEEVLEVTECHVISIAEVDNHYASSKEVDNPNEINQRLSYQAFNYSIFSLSKVEFGHKRRRKQISNVYFFLNFSFQKAKYLHIEERLTFNICF